MNVLVFLKDNLISPRGGPYAAGYYIKLERDRVGCKDIHFLDEAQPAEVLPVSKAKALLTRSILKRFLHYIRLFMFPGCLANPELSGCDIVHFHDTKSMYSQRKQLACYRGVVLLTSHSPVPLAQEISSEQLTPFERKYFRFLYKNLSKMDSYAFNRADIIIFPCPEAEEPYMTNWREYQEIKERRKGCYRYVTTGISPRIAARSRAEIRSEHGIADTDFVVSYVGRHNEVKGYGKLKELGARLLEKNNDITMLIAGKEYPITRLDNPRWIEIGYTQDPYSYISASDVFVLPNKETYFDLVMIEVLSLGKIVVASRTGGNRYYERMGIPGVLLYDTIDEAEALVIRVKSMTVSDRNMLGQANTRFFQEHLTSKAFYESYVAVLNEIGSEHEYEKI